MFARAPDAEDFINATILGVVGGLIAGYGISFLDMKMPATVAVDVAGVSRMDSVLSSAVPMLSLINYRTAVFHWPQIANGQLDDASDNRLTHVLTIFDEDGAVLDRLGVIDSVDTAVIESFFEQQDKPLKVTPAAAV